jgi:nucleotide-binding universal stress UspA family protein
MANILLPADFSEHSLNAIAYALDLFGTAGNTFTLVHAYIDPVPGYDQVIQMSSANYVASVEGMARFAQRVQQLPGAANASVKTQVVYGLLTTAMHGLCMDGAVDMIIMGTQGASGNTFFGSSAAAMVKNSSVPVLVVPQHAHYTALRHVLLADDRRPVEPASLQPLRTLAQRTGARITIAHVQPDDPPPSPPPVPPHYAALFAHLPTTYTQVPGTDIAHALSITAIEQHADLVAVLHRHTGLLDTLFHSSVAKQMALHSDVPLLVLVG